MNPDEAHEHPVPVKEDSPVRRRPSVRRTVCGAVGLMAALLSAVFLVPSPAIPRMSGYLCGLRLLYSFLATFFLCISSLRSRGPNVAAKHGGTGLLAGYLIGCIHLWPSYGSGALPLLPLLFAAFPDAAFGIILGVMRSSIAEAVAENASVHRKVFGAGGFVVVLLSAVLLVPSQTGFDGLEDLCGFTLLYIFLATLFLCLGFLRSFGPNVAAEHGGMGLLAGYLIGCIHTWPTKFGGPFSDAAFALGSIPGAAYGVVIGLMRSSLTEPVAENESDRENRQDREKENGRQAADELPE